MTNKSKSQANYLSVTEVLSKYQNYSFTKQEYLARGTLIHGWIENYIKGLFCPMPFPLEKYCESFKKWYEKNVGEVYSVEERLYDDDLMFCGKPDFIGKLKTDTKNCIVDWKSSQGLNKFWQAQMSAYIYLTEKNYNPNPNKALSLRLMKDGTEARPHAYDMKNMIADFNGGFLPALNAHRYFLGGK